jgi:putative DNA primase/helicase
VSLRGIVKALGGDLYDRGRRANVPAPGHSAADRSISLLLQDDRVVVHSFGGGDWRDVLDGLRERRLIDADNVLVGGRSPGGRATAGPTQLERHQAAMRLWDAGRPIAGTLSERHVRMRGVTRALPGPEALRHVSEAPVAVYRDGRLRRPALVAGVQDATGAYTAVELTYLAPNGRRASDLRLPRKTIGLAPGGCAVRLDPAAEEMLVAEGVFSTFSAAGHFGLPGWALMSTRNVRAWRAPDGVRFVLIAGDRGADGERSAQTLRRALRTEGVRTEIALPPAPFGDWNEWAQRC